MLYIAFLLLLLFAINGFKITTKSKQRKREAASIDRRKEAEEYFKNNPEPSTTEIELNEDSITIEVAGVHISSRKRIIQYHLETHDDIKLVPEPKNPVNNKAIAIKSDRGKIGYVSEDDLELVWDIFDRITEAHVADIDALDEYITVEIDIYYRID